MNASYKTVKQQVLYGVQKAVYPENLGYTAFLYTFFEIDFLIYDLNSRLSD